MGALWLRRNGWAIGKFARFANVGFKSGTRIIALLVSSSIPKFAQRSLRMLVNFGIGTLAPRRGHRMPRAGLSIRAILLALSPDLDFAAVHVPRRRRSRDPCFRSR